MVQTKKLANFIIRPLGRSEVMDIWHIDRSEIIEEMYRLQDGQLVLEPRFYDVRGWPEGEAEIYTPILLDCYDHDGIFLGAEVDGALVAIAITDVRPVGLYPEFHQLGFMHVDKAVRGFGLAGELYRNSMAAAKEAGAKGFYISATPTRRTIDFYMKQGAEIAARPDPVLFEREPEDIHLIHRFNGEAS
ncbi:putative N-acetyltransferase YhbS [Ochrobactrum sp. J50]|jgi:predicted N-acetyltransferase YhbS|nr:GNAT family N-acetyltransferase [Brucella pseudintermedia]NKE75050.1 GNAT family N-acetyltransferase [Ochrobactrum sp. MC-1LL]TWH04319.1 putative N-acetyltransferase YhbS [Ochrobactrum sp. J50]